MYLGMLRAWYEDRVPTNKNKKKETKIIKVCQNHVLAKPAIFCLHPHDNPPYLLINFNTLRKGLSKRYIVPSSGTIIIIIYILFFHPFTGNNYWASTQGSEFANQQL